MRVLLGGWTVAVAGVLVCLGACGGDGATNRPTADVDGAADDARDEDAGDPTDAPRDAAFATAAHPRSPLIQNQGGASNASPQITSVTFAATYLNAVSDYDAFVAGVVTQPYWAATTSEYGVGAATVSAPLHLTEAAPMGAIQDSDVKAWLTAKIEGGAPGFAGATNDSLFVLFYPSTTTVNLPPLTACHGVSSYHGNTQATVNGQTVYPTYAVLMEACLVSPDAGATRTVLQQMTTWTSHELVEAVTDPLGMRPIGGAPPVPAYQGTMQLAWNMDPYAAWSLYQYDAYAPLEVGDMCQVFPDSFVTPPGFPYMVQRSWSNAAVRDNRDPCVPVPSSTGPYYLAQPVFDPNFATDEATSPPTFVPRVNFQVPLLDDGGATFRTQGVHVAVGRSATIPIVLWSEAPVVDWQVGVADPFFYPSPSPYLSFSLDKTSGNNGDVIHMTVTVKAVNPRFGGQVFAVGATDGVTQHFTFGFVSSE